MGGDILRRPDQSEPSKKINVIYVTSLSHSGSTLLDVMLNAHTRVFSVGELKQLTSKLRARSARGQPNRCSCGVPFLDCPFWSAVNDEMVLAGGLTLEQLNVTDYSDEANFQRDTVLLFDAIRHVSRASFIVDSSKDLRRLKLLLRNPRLNVFPIHLQRDPRGQIYSMLRKEQKSALMQRAAYYGFLNSRINRNIRGKPHASITYEELVASPVESLRTILGPLELEFQPAQLRWAEEEKHHVGGNRMRRGVTAQSNSMKLGEIS